VQLKQFPDDVLRQLKTISEQVVTEIAERDPMAKKIYASYSAFQKQAAMWQGISEQAYTRARSL